MSTIRPCPLCGRTDARPHLTLAQHKIEIVRCRGCGLLYRPVSFDDLAVLYTEDYYRHKSAEEAQWGGSGDYVADRDRLLRTFDEHVAQIEQRHARGRLLDVGCATGCLLEAARRRGWEVVGLEISDYAASYAQREFGLDVRIGTVETTRFPDGHFDVITAFEYIEHVDDPAGILRQVRPWLKSDGLLVMTTPNAGSWAARRHPERFDGFLEWRHLVYFSRRTMTQLLRQAGFEPTEIQTDFALVTVNTLAGWGVARPERWRAAVNRVAPGLKRVIRRVLGAWCGGSSMKIYAKPV